MHILLCAILPILLFFLPSCMSPALTCRSEYLYPPYLASVQANTPDPFSCSFYGQQIVVHWNLSKQSLAKPLNLLLHIRYGNRELETISTLIKRRRGWWIYRLMDQDYLCKEGILAFQAQLVHGEEVLEQWTHYLWADIIEVSP